VSREVHEVRSLGAKHRRESWAVEDAHNFDNQFLASTGAAFVLPQNAAVPQNLTVAASAASPAMTYTPTTGSVSYSGVNLVKALSGTGANQ
jgi:hypothetical protein